jgi:hypothetical protein
MLKKINKEADIAFNNAIAQTGLHFLMDNNCRGGKIFKRKATYTID